MSLAIEEMYKSIHEPRADKALPKVGAVLEFPDGEILKAHRGELRDGDHAEYTLIERKCRDKDVSGTTLYATLEPCAPGARSSPKLSCAERIVLARISKVWVGIADPDPTVDRKGIKYLQDNGVDVEMFDRDLQEQIEAANKDFIDQAVERAMAEQAPRKEIQLSGLENPLPTVALKDLSTDALTLYKESAQINESIDSAEFHRRLIKLGVLSEVGKTVRPTGFGQMLFGKEPRLLVPQAALLATIHYADETEEVQDFDGPLVMIPELALDWIRSKIPNPIDRTEAKRKLVNEGFFTVLREGMVNALVHRDYGIDGAKCQLVVWPDRIEVRSPGMPVEPITLEQLKSFSAPMLSRNPILHYIFASMGMAEERGLGLKSMRQESAKADLPLPSYSWNAPYLTLTVFRSSEGAIASMLVGDKVSLSADERKGLKFIATVSAFSRQDYVAATGFADRKAQRQLKRFTDLALIEKVGMGPSASYRLRDQ